MQEENGKRGWEASCVESDGRGPVWHGRLRNLGPFSLYTVGIEESFQEVLFIKVDNS